MATELGKLITIYEADTSKFDAASRRVESRLRAVKATAVSETKSIQDQFGISSAIIRKTADDFDRVGAGASSGLGAAKKAINDVTQSLTPLTAQQVRYRTELARTVAAERASASRNLVANVAEREVAAQARRIRAAVDVAKIQGQTTRDTLRNDILIRESQKAVARALDITAATNIRSAQTATESSRKAGTAAFAAAGATRVFTGSLAGLAAVGASLVGLFKLAQFTADFGAKLDDLSQRTGITVGTLSTLKVAAENSGASIESTNKSLGRYLKTVSEANSGNEEIIKKFKQVGFTNDDLTESYKSSDKAISILVKRVGELSSEEDRLNALQKLGIRNGDEFNGVITEMRGNMEAFRREAERLGLVITPEQAREADKFDKALRLLELQVKGMAYSIAREYLPQISGAISDVSNSLSSNKGAWANWGEFIRGEIRGVRVAASGLAAFIAALPGVGGHVGVAGLVGIRAMVEKSRRLHAAEAAKDTVGGTFSTSDIFRRKLGGSGGGGGRGGGGASDRAQELKRIAELELRAIIDSLEAEQNANRRSLDLRRQDFNTYAEQYTAIEKQRHEAVIKGLDAEQKAAERLKRGREPALLEIENKRLAENRVHQENRNRVLDERGKILDRITDFIRDQGREITGVTDQTDQWEQAHDRLVDSLRDEGVELEERIQQRIRSNIELLRERDLIRSITRAREVLKSVRERAVTAAVMNRPDWMDLGGGSVFGGEPGTTTRPRIATVEEQVLRERIAIVHDQMHQLAADLTGMLDRALYEGISGGAKRGLQSLTMSLLDMIQQIILGRLKNALAEALSGAATGGGGGGFLSGLFQSLLGSLFGIGLGKVVNLGGGSTFTPGGTGTTRPRIVGRQSGGDIWPGQLYQVHRDEVIAPTKPGHVFNPMQMRNMGGGDTHIHIHVPVSASSSYSSKRSRRQLAEELSAAVQGALA